MTLAELRTKEVIDVQDGRRLGKVMDLEFSVEDSRITALVVPSETSFLQSLRGEKCGLVIPWEDVRRIGDDERGLGSAGSLERSECLHGAEGAGGEFRCAVRGFPCPLRAVQQGQRGAVPRHVQPVHE